MGNDEYVKFCSCAEAFLVLISGASKSIVIVVCATMVRSGQCSKHSDKEFVCCSFVSGDVFDAWVSGVQSKGKVKRWSCLVFVFHGFLRGDQPQQCIEQLCRITGIS